MIIIFKKSFKKAVIAITLLVPFITLSAQETDDSEYRAFIADKKSMVEASSLETWHPAVLAGVTPEPGVTFAAKAMSLVPCNDVADELKLWDF